MTCRQAISIATGPGRPTLRVASIEAAASELRRRATSPDQLRVRPAALSAPGLPTAVLAVHDRGQGDELLGYVCGLGHDCEALDAALASDRTADEVAPFLSDNLVVSGSTGLPPQPPAAGANPC